MRLLDTITASDSTGPKDEYNDDGTPGRKYVSPAPNCTTMPRANYVPDSTRFEEDKR